MVRPGIHRRGLIPGKGGGGGAGGIQQHRTRPPAGTADGWTAADTPPGKDGAATGTGRERYRRAIRVGFRAVAAASNAGRGTGHRATAGAGLRHREGAGHKGKRRRTGAVLGHLHRKRRIREGGASGPTPPGKGGAATGTGRERHRRAIRVGFRAVAAASNAGRGTGHRATAGAGLRHREGAGHKGKRRRTGAVLGHLHRKRRIREGGASGPTPPGKGGAATGTGGERHRRAVRVGFRAVAAATNAGRGTGDRATAGAGLGHRESGAGHEGKDSRDGTAEKHAHRTRPRAGTDVTLLVVFGGIPCGKDGTATGTGGERHRRAVRVDFRAVAAASNAGRDTSHRATAGAGLRHREGAGHEGKRSRDIPVDKHVHRTRPRVGTGTEIVGGNPSGKDSSRHWHWP